MKQKYLKLLLVTLSLVSLNIEAAGFRCKTGQHVKDGMTVKQLVSLCGKPDQKFKAIPEHLITELSSNKKTKVWLYLPAKNAYQQYLIIRKNKIQQIIRGTRI